MSANVKENLTIQESDYCIFTGCPGRVAEGQQNSYCDASRVVVRPKKCPLRQKADIRGLLGNFFKLEVKI